MSGLQIIAFFTGQSRPGCCALSPEQEWFWGQLAAPAGEFVPLNFPYRASGCFREVPLLRASWRNFCGYIASRRPGFAAAYRGDVAALIARAERVMFLAGSSGLELFNNLGLSEAEERKCRVERVLRETGCSLGDLEVVPHQASGPAVELITRRLGISRERLHATLAEHGNLVAASLPFVLHGVREKKPAGTRVMLLGTAAGYTQAVGIITL